MKEDVLEQIVDDYLQSQGYFTRHNIKFRPHPTRADYISREDAVASDIDVIGVHPKQRGRSRVIAVSCKSWQTGFDPAARLAELRGEKKNPKRATWRSFRELWIPKWSDAFVDAIEDHTGQRTFDYRIAVTRLRGNGNPNDWANDPTIKQNLPGCTIGFLTLPDMWNTMAAGLGTTPAPSEIGRLAQLLIASNIINQPPKQVPAQSRPR